MTDMIKISGKCHCGAISIKAEIGSDMVVACHCVDCRVFGGGPFRAVAIAKAENFEMEGKPVEYVKIADSGNKRLQAFCGACGTHLYATDEERRGFNIRTGFLDQHETLVPLKHIFAESSPGWLHEMDGHAWVVRGPNSETFKPGGK